MRKVVLGAAIGAEPGEGRAPMTFPPASREVVEAREPGEVARVDRARPGAPGDIPGELRPEGRLHADAFLHHDRASVGQPGTRPCAAIAKLPEVVCVDGEAQMVRAHDELVGRQRILRLRQTLDLAQRLIAGARHLARLHRQTAMRLRPRQEGVGLTENERKVRAQQGVEHSRPGFGRVFAERKNRSHITFTGWPDFEPALSADHPVRVDRCAQRPTHDGNGHPAAGDDKTQRLADFREQHIVFLTEAQAADAVRLQAVRQNVPQIFQGPQHARVNVRRRAIAESCYFAPGLTEDVTRRDDQRNEIVVPEQPAVEDARPIGPVEPGGEARTEPGWRQLRHIGMTDQVRGDVHVVVRDVAEQRVQVPQTRVAHLWFFQLEGRAIGVTHRHHGTVPQQDGLFGHMPDIRQINFAGALGVAAVAAHQIIPRPRAGTRIGLGLTVAPPHVGPSIPRAAVRR